LFYIGGKHDISDIANMHITLQRIANHSKTPQRRGFRLAAEITKRLISNKVDYAFIIQDDTVYFEELDKDGKIVEVVGLDLTQANIVSLI